MATPGTKPKPTRVKELEGNPGHRAINRAEPKPDVAEPRALPYGVTKTARGFHKRYAPLLVRLGILTEADEAAFNLMSLHYGLAIDAARELREAGLTVDGRDGPKKHPLAQVFRDNSSSFRQYAGEFGMTPSARSRLSVEDAEQMSLADILFASVTAGDNADERE